MREMTVNGEGDTKVIGEGTMSHMSQRGGNGKFCFPQILF